MNNIQKVRLLFLMWLVISIILSYNNDTQPKENTQETIELEIRAEEAIQRK